MNEDTFNVSLRSFLKMVGINSQRAIEKAVQEALAKGAIKGDERLPVTMTLEIPRLTLTASFEGEIRLEARGA